MGSGLRGLLPKSPFAQSAFFQFSRDSQRKKLTLVSVSFVFMNRVRVRESLSVENSSDRGEWLYKNDPTIRASKKGSMLGGGVFFSNRYLYYEDIREE